MTMCRTQSSLKRNVTVALISSIFSGIIMNKTHLILFGFRIGDDIL